MTVYVLEQCVEWEGDYLVSVHETEAGAKAAAERRAGSPLTWTEYRQHDCHWWEGPGYNVTETLVLTP